MISAMNAPTATVGYICRAGDWGGYGPLLGSPRQADVIARTPAVILFVPYVDLRCMFRDNPVWWEDLARLALSDVYRFGSLGTDLLIKDSRARAAAILLHQAGCRRTGDGPVMVAATQAELGEMANLSRHPIARILHDFDASGWITCGYRRIDLLDVPALRQVADGF
jgi:CRP/FNR family transcriptional regulator